MVVLFVVLCCLVGVFVVGVALSIDWLVGWLRLVGCDKFVISIDWFGDGWFFVM